MDNKIKNIMKNMEFTAPATIEEIHKLYMISFECIDIDIPFGEEKLSNY